MSPIFSDLLYVTLSEFEVSQGLIKKFGTQLRKVYQSNFRKKIYDMLKSNLKNVRTLNFKEYLSHASF